MLVRNAPTRLFEGSTLLPVAAASLSLLTAAPRALAYPSSFHSEQGFVVMPLACGLGNIQFASGPGTNAFDTQLYVLLSDHELVGCLNEFGKFSRFADLDKLGPDGPFLSPTFDVLSHYDGSLFMIASPRHIGEVDPSGDASSFVPRKLGASPRRNIALGCDPYGAFGGQLFLTDSAGLLYTLAPNGKLDLFATGLGGSDHDLLFSPGGAFGDDLYIADTDSRRILHLPADHVAGDAAPVWLEFGKTDVAPVSIAISLDGPFGSDVMYVSDTAGRIIKLSATGEFLGEFIADLPGPAEIELPNTDTFKDQMVVAAGGNIWLVLIEPSDETARACDLDGDRDIASILLLLGELGCAGPECVGDLNSNGFTDPEDLTILLKCFAAVP